MESRKCKCRCNCENITTDIVDACYPCWRDTGLINEWSHRAHGLVEPVITEESKVELIEVSLTEDGLMPVFRVTNHE